MLVVAMAIVPLARAGVDVSVPDSKKIKDVAESDAKPAPLPLHQFEGSGGLVTTLSAYIVNPQRAGQTVGLPAVGFGFLAMGHGKDLAATTLTWSPISRMELGYAWDHLSLGNFAGAVRAAGVPGYQQNAVNMQNANIRFQVIKDGDFGQSWVPALTLGVHYKYNQDISTINQQIAGGLTAAGISHSNGCDVTLYASKLITQLPVPVMINAGGRATEGVWDGLGGFTNQYNFLFEGNVIVMPLPNLALGAEFKQMATDYTPIGNLVPQASNWWTLDAAYVVNKNWTVALAYAHMGNVLNSQCNGTFGFTTKWEF